jgi:regulator of protease activity HflC (stomatin/prohibitin superfamily)
VAVDVGGSHFARDDPHMATSHVAPEEEQWSLSDESMELLAPDPPKHRALVRAPRDPRPWPYRRMGPRPARAAAMFTIAMLVIAGAVLVSGARLSRQDAGHVGIVRNGGPLDDRGIRQILMPGQRVTWIGLYSQAPREYPAARIVHFYTITGDARRGDRREVDVVHIPTRDGVQVGIEATVFFHFTGERDIALLRRFDQTFGNRRFPVAGSDKMLRPWDGEAGFGALLDSTFRPVLDNNLRAVVGKFGCAQLIASCALLRHAAGPGPTKSHTNRNIDRVEVHLGDALNQELALTLGGNYFRDIHVRIARVTLPAAVQAEVDDVQRQFVAVNGARASVLSARYQAKRNNLLAEAYNTSPALARIEEIKAAPKGSTIVLTGTGGKGQQQPGINVGG